MTTTIDDEWNTFLLQFNNGGTTDYIFHKPDPVKEETVPLPSPVEYIRNDCESLYISTQTKIFFLNVNILDVDTIFWKIPRSCRCLIER
jgi:hypothetical protein